MKIFAIGLLAFGIVGTLGLTPAGAQAQEKYPTKAITIVVPQTAGGGSDIIARVVAQHMAQSLKQPVLVENRPGAGGNIGIRYVARSKADGYKILMNSVGHAINPALYSNAGFDPLQDFAPVAKIADGSLLLIAKSFFGASTVPELMALAKSQTVQYASAGNGSVNHLSAVMFEKAANIRMVHIPYAGGPAMTSAVMGGQVPIGFQALASSLPFVKSGQFKVLAVLSKERLKALPNVPTVGETLPGFGVTPWYGFFAPAGTPEAILDTLHDATNKALMDKSIQAQLEAQGIVAQPQSRAEFSKLIKDEVVRWKQVVKDSGAHVD